MTRNPLVNALAATLYITVVVSLIYFAPRFVEESFPLIIPIAMLCLFTLSAAVMGFIFLSQPFQLYLDGNKSQAVNLFLQTVAVFAGITVVLVLITAVWGIALNAD